MAITITTPADTNVPLNVAHTTDHNTIVDALTTLGNSAANTAGDTFTGAVTFNGVVTDKNTDKVYGTRVDNTNITVTSSTFSDITAGYSIPANDAAVGTCYVLRVIGSGSQGSTGQTLVGQGLVNASGVAALTMAAATIPTSQTFAFELIVEFNFTTIGASGAGDAFCTLIWNETGVAVGSTVCATNKIRGTFSAIDTTSTMTLKLQVHWGSTTGAPTITGYRSTLTRQGP